jgi:MFS family permease
MHPWRGLKDLPKEIWILSMTTLINRAGTMALPFLALYLTQRLNFSAARAGLVLTVYGLGALVTAPIAGKICDSVGALRVMKLSLLLSGALLLLFPLVDSYGEIVALTIAWAVASEAFRPASMSIITEFAPTDQRKAAFALYRLAINLGMSVGPAIGGFLAMFAFQAIFYVDGATSIIAGIVLASAGLKVTRVETTETAAAARSVQLIKELTALTDGRLLYFLAALVPVAMVFFQHEAAMPLFLVRDLHISESAYGLLFSINTIIIIFLEIPLNAAMANWTDRRALSLGALLFGIGFGALAFTQGIWSVAATIVIWTFGEMIFFPSASAYVADLAPAARRGEYMGYFQMSFSLSFTISPWLGTLVLERYGSTILWSAAFLTGSLAALMMTRLAHRDVFPATKSVSV